MKQSLIVLIIVGTLGVAFLWNTTSNIQSESQVVLVDSGWTLEVTAIKFHESPRDGNPDKKRVDVFMVFKSTEGIKTPYLPRGHVEALVGTSGKVYDIHHGNSECNTAYNANGTEPTVLTQFMDVDVTEENIVKVIYLHQDKERIEIPVKGIMPQYIPHADY